MSLASSVRPFQPQCFIPKSLAEIRVSDPEKYKIAAKKRRKEHDDLQLNLQICLWLNDSELLENWQQNTPPVLQETIELPEGKLFCLKLQAQDVRLQDVLSSLPETLRSRLPQSLQLPDDLQGYVFNVAPLPPSCEAFAADDRMVLNGDGMLYRLGFQAGQAVIKTRIAKTVCYYADQLLQRLPLKGSVRLFRWWNSFRDGGIVRTSLPMGSRNQLNTAFLAIRDQLMVTFDGGRPYAIDPDSLEVLHPIGSIDKWKLLLGFMEWVPAWLSYIFQPYSTAAHPVHDASNPSAPDVDEFYIANFSAGFGLINWFNRLRRWLKKYDIYLETWGSFTHLVRCRLTGETEHWQLFIQEKPRFAWKKKSLSVVLEQAAHQLVISKNYIIIPDVSFKMEIAEIFAPFIYAIRKLWKGFPQLVPPQPYTTLYIIDRRQLEQGGPPKAPTKIDVVKAIIPYELAHFVADYDDTNDQITLHVGHTDGWDVTEWIRKGERQWKTKQPLPPELWGMQTSTTDLGSLGRYVIDGRTGTIISSKVVGDADKNTWSISVLTHAELCRDRATCTEQRIKNLYWMSWGFSQQLIPKRLYKAYNDLRENRVYTFNELPDADQPMSLLRLDTETMQIADYFKFRLGCFARSPQFVPSTAQGNGYIVCVVLDDDIKDSQPQAGDQEQREVKPNDEFWVFDAIDFKHQPIYRLEHPDLILEQTIHSTWMPSIQPSNPEERQKQRHQVWENDYEPVVKAKGKQVQKLFTGQGGQSGYSVKDDFIHQTPEAQLPDTFYP